MIIPAKLRIVLLIAGTLLIAWQFQRHHRLARQLVDLQSQLQNRNQEFESRRAALDELTRKDDDLVESERRAGNDTLIALMRERAAATKASAAAADIQGVGNARGAVLENQDLRDVERETRRAEMRANLGLFFKLAELSPERIDQYIDLQLDMESRKANRTSALLRGTIPVADALRDRDRDREEQEERTRAVLGPKGYDFLQSIADGMRNDEAKRLLGIIQLNMTDLDPQQSDRLRMLLKDQIVTIPLDDTDLFRPTDEWAGVVQERQAKVLEAAAGFLTPAQMDSLRTMTAIDLAQRQKDASRKRKLLGIQ